MRVLSMDTCACQAAHRHTFAITGNGCMHRYVLLADRSLSELCVQESYTQFFRLRVHGKWKPLLQMGLKATPSIFRGLITHDLNMLSHQLCTLFVCCTYWYVHYLALSCYMVCPTCCIMWHSTARQ